MKGPLLLLLTSLALLSWFVLSESGSLLLSGIALTGAGLLARRVRSARKERA